MATRYIFSTRSDLADFNFTAIKTGKSAEFASLTPNKQSGGIGYKGDGLGSWEDDPNYPAFAASGTTLVMVSSTDNKADRLAEVYWVGTPPSTGDKITNFATGAAPAQYSKYAIGGKEYFKYTCDDGV